MTPQLKRYYLMQASYWCQQLIVVVSKLEKPRKDYNELVAHHFVTLWLVGYAVISLSVDFILPRFKVELWDQPDAHWKCSIRIYGHPRRFPGGFQSTQLSSLGAHPGYRIRYIYWGLDVSVLLAFLFYRSFRLCPGISATTLTSSFSGLCTKTSI